MKTAILHNHPIHYKHLLFQEMAALGLDFTVLFGGTESKIRKERVSLSQDLYKYRFLSNGPLERAPLLTRIFAAWRALCDIQPEVVISGGYERPENWVGLLWGLINKAPVLLWYESNEFDWPRHGLKEVSKRLFVKGLTGAHVYGLSSRDYLIKLGLNPNSIVIKRAVVDVPRFDLPANQKQYRIDGYTRLLYVGRLAPEKNLPFLIDAFALARASTGNQLRLTIAGSGPDEQAIQNQISKLGLSEAIEMKGYVPQAELLPYLREADFFILPSSREPWGLVSLEAMLARTPVLLSRQCGCTADVISRDTGWVFSPWNLPELINLLSALPNIPAKRLQAMGDASHDLAMRYSPENCAKIIAQSIRALPRNSNRISATPSPTASSSS